MKKLTMLILILAMSCALFEKKATTVALPPVVVKKTATTPTILKRTVSRKKIKELIGYVKTFSKKRGLKKNVDVSKTFHYESNYKVRGSEITIVLNIKHDGKSFVYTCTVNVDGNRESKKVEFSSRNPAEIILQIRNSLKDIR